MALIDLNLIFSQPGSALTLSISLLRNLLIHLIQVLNEAGPEASFTIHTVSTIQLAGCKMLKAGLFDVFTEHHVLKHNCIKQHNDYFVQIYPVFFPLLTACLLVNFC